MDSVASEIHGHLTVAVEDLDAAGSALQGRLDHWRRNQDSSHAPVDFGAGTIEELDRFVILHKDTDAFENLDSLLRRSSLVPSR